MKSAIVAFCLLCTLPLSGVGALRFHSHGKRSSAITLRKRLHVNSLITDPGTVELDWSNVYSATSGDYAMPSAIRYTPRGSSVLTGRTEYSVTADAGTATLNATALLHNGDKFDFAIAPQASFFIRNESGVRLGATAIARYDSGRNSTGVTATWSAATHRSDSNPAGLFDFGFGYGRNLQGGRLMEKLTPHTNLVVEKATGQGSTVALFEGLELQMTERVALDLSGQHFSINRGQAENQIVLGLTVSLGHAH